MSRKRNIVVNQKFGRLLVTQQYYKKVGKNQIKLAHAVCICDCGNTVTVKVMNLVNGSTKSCGCYHKEQVKKSHTTHGLSKMKSYDTWNHMIGRCGDEKDISYSYYKDRGITVCDRWLEFINFYKDMGNKPEGKELDRIDNNKGYYKENCHWITHKRNCQNMKNSKIWTVTQEGKTQTFNSLSDASSFYKVSITSIKFWCDGKIQRGRFTPPEPGCYSKFKYPKSQD